MNPRISIGSIGKEERECFASVNKSPTQSIRRSSGVIALLFHTTISKVVQLIADLQKYSNRSGLVENIRAIINPRQANSSRPINPTVKLTALDKDFQECDTNLRINGIIS